MPAKLNINQQYQEAIECFCKRRATISSRLSVAFFVAFLNTLFTSVETSILWLFFTVLTQYLEIKSGNNLATNKNTPTSRNLLIYRVMCFTATLVYSLIIPAIWYEWGAVGPLFCLMALSGAILHAILTQSSSQRLMFYTIVPHALWMMYLPCAHLLQQSENKILSMGTMISVICLFIHHTFHAASLHRNSLSQHRMNEEKERSLREETQSLIDEKTRIIRNISHEIRTPLNGIIGTLEVLAQNRNLDTDARSEVQICRQSASKLYSVAKNRLDIFCSEIDAESTKENRETSLHGLLTEISDQARISSPDIDVSIEVNNVSTTIDHIVRYRDIMISFFTTLTKIAQEADANTKFIMSAEEELLCDGSIASFFSLQVIGAPQPPHLNEIYEKGENIAQKDDELLASESHEISKNIDLCDRLNILISIDSTNIGYEIRLELPAYFLKNSFEESHNLEYPQSVNSLKVLVVDDNQTNRHIANRMLSTMNIDCVQCNDGLQAVNKSSTEIFAAILMDIQMPIMDGVTATQTIRNSDGINCRTPVIAISANCQDDMQSRFQEAGINSFLEKPYTLAQLKLALADFNIHQQGNPEMQNNQQLPTSPVNTTPASQPEENPKAALIDVDLLQELEDALDREGAVEIIETCLEEISELCNDYETRENQIDEAEKRRIAHKIRGCASSACANALSLIAERIENASTSELEEDRFGPHLSTSLIETKGAFKRKYQSINIAA